MIIKCIVFLIVLNQILVAGVSRKKECSLIGHTKKVEIYGCYPFSMPMNACRGYCESWSFPTIVLGSKRHPVTSLSQCCNIMEAENVTTTILCLEGRRNIVLKSAISCSCEHCQKE